MSVDSIEQREETRELSLDEAVSLAVDLLRAGNLDDAETLFKEILQVAPDHPDALHFQGILALQRGREHEAIELINKSIAIDPNHADRYNNLGNVLRQAGRLKEALEAYQKAIALCPSHASAYANLGLILKGQGRFEQAARAYERAIECDPNLGEAYNNYGNLLVQQGKVREAVIQYAKAMTLCPHDKTSRRQIANAYVALGQEEKATEIYRKWLEEEPDNPTVKYMFAACLARDVPGRAPNDYIETIFDDFAVSFDSHLEHLRYKAPQLVADALRKSGAAPDKRLVALDAGCGTGLCGPLIKPYVARLCGVDLSSKMLERARKRDVYDELVKCELTGFLQEQRDTFDLVIAADTLVYFGALETVVESAYAALRAHGMLIFTVEAAPEEESPDGHRINPHGRYSHTRTYVERVLRDSGFEWLAIDPAELRMESGLPVGGFVVTARKGAKKALDIAVSETLARAVELHRSGALDAAGLLYANILEADPNQPDALHYAGVLALQRGRDHEAARLISKSVAVDPHHADRYNNLGNALRKTERTEEAIEAYRKAISLSPSHAGAYSNLGTVLNALGRSEEAARAFERAIECDPNLHEAYNNYGNLLVRQGKVREAVVQYSKATILRPRDTTSKRLLAAAYVALGQHEAAAAIYRKWLEEDPENAGAKYLLAACLAVDVPDRAPDAYIETAFDDFADSFDARLEHLGYQAPQLVADALRNSGAAPAKRLLALDAGCGTGLCAPLIEPYVARLCGVDLSSGMLENAQRQGIYDELVKSELTHFMQKQCDAFDLVISADTLVYFGALEPVFKAAHGALRAPGLLIFTVEAAPEGATADGYQITPHGRYSHSRRYLEETLRDCGFSSTVLQSAVLRMESGVPVHGLVVTARKARTTEQRD